MGCGRKRVMIEGAKPEIDYGRHPIKRTVGEKVVVEVDVFTDEGSSRGNPGVIEASPISFHGRPYSTNLTLPPLGAVLFKHGGVSHSDPGLVEAVRRGRREEFAAFGWLDEPPDPQDEATFQKTKLNHSLRNQNNHRFLFEFYGELIQFKKAIPALANMSKDDVDVMSYEQEKVLTMRRWNTADEAVAVFHFGEVSPTVDIPLPEGRWIKRLDSTDKRRQGPGSQVSSEVISEGEGALSLSPHAFVLFIRERRS